MWIERKVTDTSKKILKKCQHSFPTVTINFIKATFTLLFLFNSAKQTGDLHTKNTSINFSTSETYPEIFEKESNTETAQKTNR